MFLVSHNNLRATVTKNLRGLRLTLQEMSLLRGKKCVKKSHDVTEISRIPNRDFSKSRSQFLIPSELN